MDFAKPIIDAIIWSPLKGFFMAIISKWWVILILIVLYFIYRKWKFLRNIIRALVDFITKFLF
jgi:hypothetical protein